MRGKVGTGATPLAPWQPAQPLAPWTCLPRSTSLTSPVKLLGTQGLAAKNFAMSRSCPWS